jgi:hypothetical protein
LCLDPRDYHSLRLANKVIRALQPEQGKIERDRRIRAMKRDQIIRQLNPVKEGKKLSFLPNFGLQKRIQYDEKVMIQIPANGLKQLAEKIVRGIVYISHVNSLIINISLNVLL